MTETKQDFHDEMRAGVQSSSDRPDTDRPRVGRIRRYVAYPVAGLMAITAAGALTTLALGRVEGWEFSADRFERRAFFWYEIPLVGWQVTPVVRQTSRGPVEQWIAAQPWFTTGSTGRWDVIRASRGGEWLDPQGASLLCAYLDAQRADGASVWLAWSQEHPMPAPWLWKTVVLVARSGRYELLPDLFQQAQEIQEDPPAFAETLARTLQRQSDLLRRDRTVPAPPDARQLLDLEHAMQRLVESARGDSPEAGGSVETETSAEMMRKDEVP